MNRTIVSVTFLTCATAWACSSDDSSPTPEPTTETEATATMPAGAPDTRGSEDGGEAGRDATPSEAGPKADAGLDAGSVGCANESEPNDETSQQMPRSLCGTLTAGDRDRFYIEGRQDEPIEVIFSADGDALVTFATNAGLGEAYFGKSFKTTVKPGGRKLFIDVALPKAPVAYHFAFERK